MNSRNSTPSLLFPLTAGGVFELYRGHYLLEMFINPAIVLLLSFVAIVSLLTLWCRPHAAKKKRPPGMEDALR